MARGPKFDQEIKSFPEKQDSEWTEDASSRQALAARYTQYEKSLTFWQTFRIYWRCILWILYGQAVVFGYGIDGVIAAFLLGIPRFRQDYGEPFDTGTGVAFIISAEWISAFNGVSQLTAILGALGTGYLADRIGRKYTNMISCVISIAGVGAQYASTSSGSLGILCAGKAINGIPIGMWLVLGPLYASEVAPLQLRGWLTAVTNIIQFSGVLLFTGILYNLGPRDEKLAYELPFACQWIIPSLVLLTVLFWPESPVWLVRVGKTEQAVKSLRRIHGANSSIDKAGILAQIEETLEHERSSLASPDKNTYMECFSKEHRSRTLICMFVYGCQYLSGLVFVLGYQSYYYQLIGFGAQKSFLLSMLNNAFQFIGNICSWFLIASVGRRPVIVWGQLVTAICLFIIGGCSEIGTTPGYLATVSFMFVWGFAYQLTLGTAAWSVVAEIPAIRLRARTQGLANLSLCFTQWLIGFIFPYMFNPDAGNLGGKVGYVFGATTFVGFLGVYVWLPETKGRTAAELDELYENGVPPRQFHKVKTDAQSNDSNHEAVGVGLSERGAA